MYVHIKVDHRNLPVITDLKITRISKLRSLISEYLLNMASCKKQTGPRGYKTFFMLNSAEHEICPANKSQITNNYIFFLAKCSLATVGIFIFISREIFMLSIKEVS